MKIKTSELEGEALNCAVAKAVEKEVKLKEVWFGVWMPFDDKGFHWNPSSSWSKGGPLIEQYKVGVSAGMNGKWCAVKGMPHYASTPLIAAMRAIVAFELGDEIDVPDDLA